MKYHEPDDETAQRYAMGSLPPHESTAFEQHLLTCAECRDEVRLASGIRSELAQRPTLRKPRVYAAGVGLAATLIVVISLPERSSMASLGDVASAPGYEGIAVRASADAADSAFAAAMELYGRGGFKESADALRAARAIGADTVTTTFFLGASLLMADRPEGAAEELARAARMGPTPYTAESHFYRAKALLRLDNSDEALRALAAAAAIDSPIRAHAQALADSIGG